ncbi:hypothetical protein BA746_00385 [Vibrio parahaemolyticus]|uniref:hypothetical protein n=1 Tax=Vibrio parahaemolyticus TaxID=670 RepID=UPI0006A5F720|nr:hypothetical protein [Vibrio parahaemolyticus]EIE5875895.1 hypothetical protein [Vibrio parahaemolyticus]KOF30959.1 hypothetical protein ACX04_15990 [Vibrio parahaemolyticus]OTW07826.1 hypothetical protein BA743_16380 [Vibrio parahaemolyticus]OTW23939.1 hypothetical protein BA744_00995 [Vibrio parahaemolyticus]OTW27251.1 hypothetical protein BA746_00385 [Vibrio parahaemolyticus]
MVQKINLFDLFDKYLGKERKCGVVDCNLMLLEYLGFDTTQIEPFNNPLDGRRNLRKACNAKNMSEYLTNNGWSVIEPLRAYDGDIVIKGIHCGIIYNGMMFGVCSKTNTFQFLKLSLEQLQKLKIFRKQ